ncbi:DUF5786 family protein [Halopiger xanaduensis]|uniref:DUF5786 domain-containing protein n=1 Tax=Halopiger xanaduensis (strain DSM 18323 / JCM 14033 / SH-6) TaxID=797210 RepID=F8D5X2_HALXS|nr:DUF5786 family protein [Halopiger xanaduensis]AEH37698.1 hypothetical protein Halxa_3084 [Halopiger xanaduensis SH-6]
MGFGSYDESEQQQQTNDDDDNAEAVNIHENDHNGEMSFESDVSTDELVSQLGSMKDEADDEA